MKTLPEEAPLALFELPTAVSRKDYSERAVQFGSVSLAAKTWGNLAHPIVMLVHGYPDNSEVWHEIVSLLVRDYYAVAYSVWGAGRSSSLNGTRNYTLARLTDDFIAAIDALSPGKPVHLIVYDRGSIQLWEFVTEECLRGRIASYTSCLGPCLDHVGHWTRVRLLWPTPSSLGKMLGQLVRLWYVLLLHLSIVPELSWRLRLGRTWPRVLRRVEKTAIAPRPTQTADGVRGVSLYCANFIRSLFMPCEYVAYAPVRVIVSTLDKYASPALSEDLSRWVPQYWRREVVARHWLSVTYVARMTGMVRDLIEHAEGRPESKALQRARQYGERKPLCGKPAVIMSAGDGIGRCVVLEFAEQGVATAAVDIRTEDAERTAKLIHLTGDKVWAYTMDVGNAEQMEVLVDWAGKELGGANIVVNNAGTGMAGGIVDTPERDWQRILHVNVWGAIHGARLLVKQMVAHGQGGHILNTVSAVALAPSHDPAAYAITKAAVLMPSECMCGEPAGQGTGVPVICPGFAEIEVMASMVHSDTTEAQQAQLRTHATKLYQLCGLKPETVAKAMSGTMQHNKSVVTIGIEVHSSRFISRYAQQPSRLIARASMAGH